MSPEVLFKVVFKRSDEGESVYFLLVDENKPQDAIEIANKKFRKDYDGYWCKVSVEVMGGEFIRPESAD